VLAAIVIHAVSKSWRLTVFKPYLQWKRDRTLALSAVIAVLSLGILNGLLVAIAISLILLIRQFAMARLSVLGRFEGGHDFVAIGGHPQAVEVPGDLIMRPEEPLFFANAEAVFAHARKVVEERANLQRVILSLEESPDLDSTALEALADFASWLQARGVPLRVARLKEDARELLLCAALPQLPAHTLNYWSVEDAVLAVESPAH
jgi:MFS superfamily sulfate permease-like transporter